MALPEWALLSPLIMRTWLYRVKLSLSVISLFMFSFVEIQYPYTVRYGLHWPHPLQLIQYH